MCKNRYAIPGTDSILPEGVEVEISLLGAHYDEEYFPDPQRFDPERFFEANKNTLPHYAYMPFGEGPRNCIGMF